MDKKHKTDPISTAPSFRRLSVPPARGSVRPEGPLIPSSPQPDIDTPAKKGQDSFYLDETISVPKDLAAERSKHGFDDIPVSADPIHHNDSLWKLFTVWITHIFSRRHPEESSRSQKGRNYLRWKEDLKWAIKADLDERDPQDPASKPRQEELAKQKVQKTIDININISPLPKLPKPSLSVIRQKLPRPKRPLLTRKRLAIGGLVLLIFAGSFVGYQYLTRPAIVTTTLPDGTTMTTNNLSGKPEYPTMLPEGKSIETLGGWTRVSPADREPVFAYVDTIGPNRIIVSQQPLPKQFKDDTASQVENFAKGYLADVKITAGNITAYIGTSAKGPQSVIFTKNNLLILIKSSVKIETAKWGEYISSLR